MHHHWDDDEWELVIETSNLGSPWHAAVSVAYRRRDPVETASLKDERKRREEDEILRRADEIRQRRGVSP